MSATSVGFRLVAFAGVALGVVGRFFLSRTAVPDAKKRPVTAMIDYMNLLFAPSKNDPGAKNKSGISNEEVAPAKPVRGQDVAKKFFEHRRKNPDQHPTSPIAKRMRSGRA